VDSEKLMAVIFCRSVFVIWPKTMRIKSIRVVRKGVLFDQYEGRSFALLTESKGWFFMD